MSSAVHQHFRDLQCPYLVLVALIRGAPMFVSDLPFHKDSSCSKVVSQIHSIHTSLLASD